jgi:hypothetical protein
MANAITLENQKQGNPESEWGLENGASSSIEGFTTDMSYNIGSTVDFKINTDTGDYRIDIYRLGYYDGLGARYIGTLDHHTDPTFQPNPLFDSSTGLVDAGNWEVTDSWEIPSDATSGVYIAKLVREDGTFGENQIPFIVRNDAGQSDIVFKTSDETWQAYNSWGGNSVYESSTTPAVALSYNRPFTTATGGGSVRVACSCGRGICADCAFVANAQGETVAPARPWNFIFGEEYPAIRWLERNGYDVSYVAGVDLARSGESLLDHKIFLSVGHDEYWSAEQRTAVENARDAGVNLAFWSGNEVYWKTRWADAISDDGTGYRTLITYKETNSDAKVDPSTEWTGLWRDERFENGTENIVPENALTGTFYKVDHDLTNPLRALTVSSDYAEYGLWRNTSIADGQTMTFANLIGYEWDIDADNGYRPATLVPQSSTTIQSNAVLLDDYAHSVGVGTATHSLTLYRADSGALVFGAGTVMFTWALDSNHALGPGGSGAGTPEYRDIQQAMINLFADMGVNPETLQDNLVPGGVPNDSRAPDVTINPWLSNLKYYSGDTISLSGTASDLEGHLAGVTASLDTYPSFRTSNTGDWSVVMQVIGVGAHSINIRAFDTSLNVSAPAIATVNVGYSPTGYLEDFSVAQGWSNTVYKRIFADLDGDGIKDLVGFGESATLGYFGGTDPVTGGVGFRTPGTINVIIPDFAGAQGYTATSVRGVDFLGDFVGGGSKAATVWAQGQGGISYYVPTAVDADSVTYSSAPLTYSQFGTSSGWNSTDTLAVGFVAQQSAYGSDSYGSIFGFGDAGLTLAREAFAPGSSAAASYLVAGSSAFGNNAGWTDVNDIRAIRDSNGNEIDLNRDGIVDVLGVGNQGTMYAFGQLTPDGAGGSTYSLGPAFTALNGASGQGSDFGTAQGWTKSGTPRFIADVNNDGYVDVIGFGIAGIYVSEGRAPNADGSGAFAQNYLAIADYGTDSGWGAVDHVREFGDINGDGVIDIIGFGDEKTIVATGAINAQTGRISWTMDGLLGDFAIAEGWQSSTHLRSVVDMNGDGRVEIFAAGDFNTRIIAQA